MTRFCAYLVPFPIFCFLYFARGAVFVVAQAGLGRFHPARYLSECRRVVKGRSSNLFRLALLIVVVLVLVQVLVQVLVVLVLVLVLVTSSTTSTTSTTSTSVLVVVVVVV